MRVWDLSARVKRALFLASEVGEAAGVPRLSAAAGSPAASGVTPPPGGNTGGKLTVRVEVRCHWLNCIIPTPRRLEAAALVDALAGEGENRDYGLHSYQQSRHWEGSGMMCWSEGREECWLSLPGGFLDGLTPKQTFDLMKALDALGAKGRRLDVAADDLSRSFSMEDVHAAAAAGDFCGFQIDQAHQPRCRGELIGDSHDFGRRGKDGGGTFVQVYDKNLESDGAINAIRVEARFFKEKAEAVFKLLCICPDMEWWRRKLGELVGGAIDFRERGEETHLDRMARLDWWERFVGALGEAAVSVGRVVATIEKWCGYAAGGVLPTIAVFLTLADSVGADGWEKLREAVGEASKRVNWRRASSRLRGVEWEACVSNLMGGPQYA